MFFVDRLPENKLRRVNNALSVLVIVINLFIFVYPFTPLITQWINNRYGAKPGLVAAYQNRNNNTNLVIPEKNTLVIPSMNLQEEIFEGHDARTLRNGVWHRPNTSSPDLGSNTVLVGHRLTYSGKAVFYNLDKVKAGDEILVYWNKKRYTYKVANIEEVAADAVAVEAPSNENTLTLYTCTPIWTAKNRLVIVAKLEGVKSD